MAASVKIEFDDGSRVISQTLEDTAGIVDSRIGRGGVLSGGKRSASCSIYEFYEIPKTTAFIADGKFRRVALQFPDALLREAPEVLWTLQAQLRKLTAGSEEGREKKPEKEGSATTAAAPPLIFVTGDTSYGSCCVDEISAQHLKADAIVHYGRACLSPTNSSVPVLYVFGRGDLDVQHLASTLLSGPLSSPPTTMSGEGRSGSSMVPPPVLLLYDVTYAYAIPALLENLAGGGITPEGGRLVVGLPTPEAYSPMAGAGTKSVANGAGGCECGSTLSVPQEELPANRRSESGTACLGGSTAVEQNTNDCCRSNSGISGCGGAAAGRTRCSSREETAGLRRDKSPRSTPTGGNGGGKEECLAYAGRRAQGERSSAVLDTRSPLSSPPCRVGALSSPSKSESANGAAAGGIGVGDLSTTPSPPSPPSARKEKPCAPSLSSAAGCTSAAAACKLRESASVPAGEGAAAMVTSLSPTSPSSQQHQQPHLRKRRRVRIGGLEVELGSEEDLKRHVLVFVGGEGRQFSNVLMRCAGCVDRVRYDPCLPAGERVIRDTRKGSKDLMRRYYLVQRAREAGVIGIVVGTLGVQRYGSVVRSLRSMIEDAGRKAYTLAVGKVNVAKLANFAEVDVFCLVACAENSLLDSREFHAPVVTPLELEVALGKRDWDGFYSTDFDDLLGLRAQSSPKPSPPGGDHKEAATLQPTTAAGLASDAIDSLSLAESATTDGGDGGKIAAAADEDEEDDQPFFSLVTGTYQNRPGVSRKRPEINHIGDDGGSGDGTEVGAAGGALVGVGDRSLVEWSSPAADYLGKRAFQGLEALVGQTEAKAAIEGQSGIASDYGGV